MSVSAEAMLNPVVAGLLGMGVAWLIGQKLCRKGWRTTAMLVAVAPLLVYTLIITFGLAINHLGHAVFIATTPLADTVVATILVLLAGYLLRSAYVQRYSARFVRIRQAPIMCWLLFALLLTLSLIALYQIALGPAAGWDTLDYYARWAKFFIEFDQMRFQPSSSLEQYFNAYGAVGVIAHDSGASLVWMHARHPVMPIALVAMSANYAIPFFALSSPFSTIAILYLTAVFSAAVALRELGLSYRWVFTLAAMIMSVPLVENHSMNLGYSDLINFAAVGLACSLFVFHLTTRQQKFFVLGLLVSLFPLFVKNVGILYTVSLCASVFYVKAREVPFIKKYRAHVALFLGTLSIFFLFYLGILGNSIVFGGLTMRLEMTPLVVLAKNTIFLLLQLNSFSVLPIVVTVLIFGSLSFKLTKRSSISRVESALILVVVTMSGLLSLPLLVQEYSSVYSIIGHSRILIPLVVPAILLLGEVIKKCEVSSAAR